MEGKPARLPEIGEGTTLRRYTLVDQATGQVITRRVSLATNCWASLVGWIGRRPSDPSEAIGIPGNWVHTCFVAFALDLAYCDRSGRVLTVVAALPPNRLGPRVSGATVVWEMPEGILASLVTSGCVLELREVSDSS